MWSSADAYLELWILPEQDPFPRTRSRCLLSCRYQGQYGNQRLPDVQVSHLLGSKRIPDLLARQPDLISLVR